MKAKVAKIFALLMIITMVVSPVAAQPVANDSRPDRETEQFTLDVNKETVEFINLKGQVLGEEKGATGPATYIIQLANAPVASYRGGIDGLAATYAPENSDARLNVTAPETVAYARFLDNQQDAFIQSVEENIGRKNVEVAFQYKYAFNGMAVVLTPEEAARVAQMPGVSMVKRETIYQLTTDVSPDFLGASGIWDGSFTGGLPGTKGEGVILGILDTGINFDSPSFAEVGPIDGYVHVNPNGTGNFLGWCDPADPNYNAAYACNDKLIGAWDYVDDRGLESDGPADHHSHGSHTASTSGGNAVSIVVNAPTASYTPTLSGMAPHANIIAYDVCDTSGCPESSSIAATDQAVLDGVDVINFSIGGGSSDPWADAGAIAFLGAIDAGVVVVTSAGNNGPGAGTVGSPADAPWMFAVGNSTHNRVFKNVVENMSGGDTTPPADLVGMALTSGYGPASIVYAADYPNPNDPGGDPAQCMQPYPAGTFSGEIVMCDRGTIARVDKGANVLAGGAGGMVLGNIAANGESTNGDSHYLPAVHLGYTAAQQLRTWLATGSGHMATISGYTLDTSGYLADVMNSSSSRGPDPSVPDVIKPDIAAPGTDILAAYRTGTDYDLMSGTSMASPHVAGAAALMRALYPSWSVAQIRSALMTTAWTDMLKDDQVTPATPFDRGAGRVDLHVGAMAGLVLNETTVNFENADPALGGDPKTLNLASMANSACLADCSWSRRLQNTQAVSVTWTASIEAPAGITLTVTPASFEIGPNGFQTIVVDADVTGATNGVWAFGQITFEPSDASLPDSHFPVAIKPTAGILPNLVQFETRRNAGSVVLSDLEAIEITELTVEPFGLVQSTMETFELMEDPTNSDPFDDWDQVYLTMTSVPTGAKRLVAEITYSEAPDADLFVLYQTGAIVCSSTTGSWQEYCNLTNPVAGNYYIVVQNWAGSASQPDMMTLAMGVVPGMDAHNLMVTGPVSVTQATPFDLTLFWDTPTMMEGDRWYGAFSLGTDAANPGNIATVPVDIHRVEDDVIKTADTNMAMPGDTVTYNITINPNVYDVDLGYMLTDTIPAGLTYVPGSAMATEGVVSVTGDTLNWEGVAKIGQPGVVPFDGYGYFDISGFGSTYNLCFALGIQQCDESLVNLSGMDFYYLGEHYDFLTISSNGFVVPGGFANDGWMWLNQPLPHPAIPNNTLAPWWTDIDLDGASATDPGGGNWYLNFGITDGINSYTVIQWSNAQLYGDPTSYYSFQIWIMEGAEMNWFTYKPDGLVGDTSVATVGVENVSGTMGSSYYYDGTGMLPTDAYDLLVVSKIAQDPITISYETTVDSDGLGLVTNHVLHQTDNPGSKEAMSHFNLQLGLPTFLPNIFK